MHLLARTWQQHTALLCLVCVPEALPPGSDPRRGLAWGHCRAFSGVLLWGRPSVCQPQRALQTDAGQGPRCSVGAAVPGGRVGAGLGRKPQGGGLLSSEPVLATLSNPPPLHRALKEGLLRAGCPGPLICSHLLRWSLWSLTVMRALCARSRAEPGSRAVGPFVIMLALPVRRGG